MEGAASEHQTTFLLLILVQSITLEPENASVERTLPLPSNLKRLNQ